MSFIEVRDLRKEYKVEKKGSGSHFWRREYEKRHAVDGISFTIGEGETVGCIGPNGAGKSTTIKMLSGILTPTSGEVNVGGLIPYRKRKQHAKNIGVVFGQRTQLWWELPVIDSFKLLKDIYQIPDDVYRMNLYVFDEILDLKDFLDSPVRQLSLGQRVRADFAASLLHNPRLVFMDEPTIGLDVLAKEKIRRFIQEMNQTRKVTVLITSHDMDDIEQICKRTMIIDCGRLVYDGRIDNLKELYNTKTSLSVQLVKPPEKPLNIPDCRITYKSENQLQIVFSKKEISAQKILEYLFAQCEIRDFELTETSVEEIIKEVYRGVGE